ncbi:hypothetical protein [Streptomyces sp. WG7]|uniref:hypothetical protein n=1 Tax=Streptomyces sp. WG7 TaxID=3417650 RepID=UPI003CEBEAD3
MVLHELLHYAGVTDRYHDPELLFGSVPGKAFASGVMADLSAPADGRLPADYLKAIETATDSGPVVYDLPLSAPVPGDTTEGEKWSRERPLTVSARQSGTATVPVDVPRIYLSPPGSTVPPVLLHDGSVSDGLPEGVGTSPAVSAQAVVSPTRGGMLPTGMGRAEFEMVRAEVVRELKRLGWDGDPVTDARVARLHDGLPAWRQQGPVRARGEAIAQIIRTGAPVRLLGGGSGLEGEYTYLVSLPPGSYLEEMHDVALAEGPYGAVVVVETKEIYLGPYGRYYRKQREARAAGGSGEAVQMAILETIIGVARNLPGEDSRVDLDQAFLAYKDAELSFGAIRGQPGSRPFMPIGEVLRPENGWRITEDGEGALVGPRPIGDWPGAHVHHNIGVPLSVMHRFLEHVRDNTWRDRSRGYLTQDHLSDALNFADAVATRFISWKNLQGRILPDLRSLRPLVTIGDLEVQALRGHAVLLYGFAAMHATTEIYDDLGKVHAAVLPRHGPAAMLQGLPGPVQDYLSSDRNAFLHLFEGYFRARVPDFDDRYRAIQGPGAAPDGWPVQLLSLVENYLLAGLDRWAQPVEAEYFDGMTILGGLDTNHGSTLPLTVLEVRSYGERHVDWETAKEHHENLVHLARRLYRDVAVRLHRPLPQDSVKLRQVYESYFGRQSGPSLVGSAGGLRGGSPDTGVDPVAAGWPVGRAVTVEGPRRGGVDEVPASEVTEVSSGAGKAAERWFVRPSEHSSMTGYEYSDAGRIALPDGEVLSGKEWMRFGDDFVHIPSGALLRGDSGWIGRVANMESLRDVIAVLDPEAAPYTLVADASAIFLVPVETGGQAVRIAVPGNIASAEILADMPDAFVIRDLPLAVNAPDVAYPDAPLPTGRSETWEAIRPSTLPAPSAPAPSAPAPGRRPGTATQSPTSSTAAFSSPPLLVQGGADREHLVVRGDGRSLALALSDALRSRPSQRPEDGGDVPWPVADDTTDADAVAAGFDSWLDTQLTDVSDGDGVQAVSGLLPADDGTVVTETDLRGAGVVLDAGQQMRFVLSGSVMSLAELGLSPVQRLRLLLHGPQSPEATYARAVLAARKLGIHLVLTGADGTEHGVGDVAVPVIRLLSDDWYRPFLPEQEE